MGNRLSFNDTPVILPDGQEVKTHGTATVPYTVYRCIIPDFMLSYPLHYHEEIELIYCLHGSGTISVDGTDYRITSDDIAVILPNQIHSITSIDEPFEYFNVLFKFSMLEPELEDHFIFQQYFAPFTNGTKTVTPLLKKDSPSCTELSCHVLPLIQNQKTNTILTIKAHLYAIMDSLNRIAVPSGQQSSYNHKARTFLHTVIPYLNTHYSEKISIADISMLCGYSESHFMKLFRDLTGTSFSQYLIHFRLEKAAYLLRSTPKSVLEIATLCGFSNASYFTRAFERQYHAKPSVYRAK